MLLPSSSKPPDLEAATPLPIEELFTMPDLDEVTGSSLSENSPATGDSSLDQEVYKATQKRHEGMSEGKGTKRAYERHTLAYEEWWAKNEVCRAEDARLKGEPFNPIAAHPITPNKVVLFLNYETTRLLVSMPS